MVLMRRSGPCTHRYHEALFRFSIPLTSQIPPHLATAEMRVADLLSPVPIPAPPRVAGHVPQQAVAAAARQWTCVSQRYPARSGFQAQTQGPPSFCRPPHPQPWRPVSRELALETTQLVVNLPDVRFRMRWESGSSEDYPVSGTRSHSH